MTVFVMNEVSMCKCTAAHCLLLWSSLSALLSLCRGIDWFSFRVSPMYNECISPHEQSLLSVYTRSAQTAKKKNPLTVLLLLFLLFVAPTFTLSPPTLPVFFLSLSPCRREAVKAARASNTKFSRWEKQKKRGEWFFLEKSKEHTLLFSQENINCE